MFMYRLTYIYDIIYHKNVALIRNSYLLKQWNTDHSAFTINMYANLQSA